MKSEQSNNQKSRAKNSLNNFKLAYYNCMYICMYAPHIVCMLYRAQLKTAYADAASLLK